MSDYEDALSDYDDALTQFEDALEWHDPVPVVKPVPFLSLAAELRNRIYDQALRHDRTNGKVATPALLRVCKQIHREAKDYLYDFATFSVTIASRRTSQTVIVQKRREGEFEATKVRRKSSITGDMEWSVPRRHKIGIFDFNTIPEESLCELADAWPGAVYRVPRVEIVLDIEPNDDSEPSVDVALLQRLLYGLVSRFSGGRARSVKITLTTSSSALDPSVQSTLLYPIAKIPASVEVELLGATPDVKQYLAEFHTFRAVRFNGLAVLKSLPATLPSSLNRTWWCVAEHRLRNLFNASGSISFAADCCIMAYVVAKSDLSKISIPTDENMRRIYQKFVENYRTSGMSYEREP